MVDEVNAGLDEAFAAARGDETRARLAVVEHVRRWAERQAMVGQPLVSVQVQRQLVTAVLDERFGFGVLQPFMDDPQVEEILVNGPGQTLICTAPNRKEPGPPVASSEAELAEKVRRWVARAGSPREFSPARPMLNVALGVGVRLAATLAGVTERTHVAIRKQRLMDVTLAGLAGYGTVDEILCRFLSAAVRARLDVLITGGVASGKTTLMRALCAEVEAGERIITLESERELYLDHLGRHADVVSFEAREANQEGIGALDLVRLFPQVLRLRPSRVLVGEVRSGEMLALLQAVDNGLEGSMCTLHANSGSEVFGRILTLCGYSDHRLEAADLYRLIGRAIDLVVHLRQDPASGHRYVAEVTEVLEPADRHEPAINTLFAAPPGGADPGPAVPTGTTPACIQTLEACGFDRLLLSQPHLATAQPTHGGHAGDGHAGPALAGHAHLDAGSWAGHHTPWSDR